MREEEYLEKLRSVYRSVRPTDRLAFYGWKEISDSIDGNWMSKFRFINKGWALGILSILFLVVGGAFFYTNVSAALPGEALYPVKIATENVIVGMTNDNQIKVDNRAAEIVTLIEKKSEDTKALQQVSAEYSKEVKKVMQDSTVTEVKREEVRTHIEEDHQKFNEVIRNSPEAEHDIHDAIEASSSEKD